MSSISTSSTPPAGDDSAPESQPAVAAATEPSPVAAADADAVVDAVAAVAANGDAASTSAVNVNVSANGNASANANAPAQVDCGPQLKQLYPALFSSNPPKPLKLRIQADIQARAPGVFTKPQLSAFLRRYTGSHAYLNAIVKATHRFDLDGNPGDELSDEHRQAAVEELARRRANTQARRALEDEQRANRATLLREFGVNTLPAAEFAASKGIAEAELEPLLERARKEAAEPPPAVNRDRRGPAPRREHGGRGEGGERGERGAQRPRNERAARAPGQVQAAPAAGTPDTAPVPVPVPRAPRAQDAARGPRPDGQPGDGARNGAARPDGPRGARPESARGPRPDSARDPRPDGPRGQNGPRPDGARPPRGEDFRNGGNARAGGPRIPRPDVIANPVVPTAMAAAFAALRSGAGTPAPAPAAKAPAKSK